MPEYTRHQKRIIRRYYDNRDAIMVQKLSEIVSDLYLCEDEKKAARLWKSAHKAMLNVYDGKARIESIVAERDLGALAELVGAVF
jgi:hypothetical protein